MEWFLKFGVMTLLVSTIVGCDKDEDPVVDPEPIIEIKVQPKFDGVNLSLDSIYTTDEGYKVQFTDIKFYLEGAGHNGNSLTDAMLFDYRERGTAMYCAEGDASLYPSIQANLGVGPDLNHDDPSAFPNSSWLNILKANDMHWDWNPGYIFVKVDAKVDTIVDATLNLDHTVNLHAGRDENLQTVDFQNVTWTSVGEYKKRTTLTLDMYKFLQGTTQSIDFKTEFTLHSAPGQEAITLKVMQNFRDALTP